MPSTLVIQTSFIGDTILTTPLLAQLARRGAVDVVTTPASAALLANHPAVRRVIPYAKRGSDSGIGGFFRLVGELRAAAYDTALLAQGSWRSSALALFAGIPVRIGFATSAGRLLYSKRVTYRDDLHHAARLLLLARPNGREPTRDELTPSLHPGEAERAAVDALLAASEVSASETLVALAPGSVWGTKRWPYYPELAASLAGDARVVIVGGADDSELAREIVAARPDARIVDATGKLSLLASAELISRAGVIITNDSAPLHMASAVGTPTVVIFGPTVPSFGFGPLAPKSVVMGHDALPCRPCDRHGPQRCPLGHHRCMREITPADLTAQVHALLQSPDAPS